MVFCFVALIVFGIIGIFSITYRQLAKEALECVLKTAVFKPCTTGFDDKMKAKITGKVGKTSPTTAKIIYKHFQLFSWILVIITIISMVYSIQSIYNIVVYNNCYGPNSSEYCAIVGIFDTPETSSVAEVCNCNFSMANCDINQVLECNYDCDCLYEKCG